jgi:hypothetical protein
LVALRYFTTTRFQRFDSSFSRPDHPRVVEEPNFD